jgi:ribonuclease R
MTTTHRPDELRDRILQLFEKYPNEYFKPTEIARRLSVRDDGALRSLLKTLHELHQEQLIGRARRKRYGHITPPATHRHTGVLTMTKQGHGIVELQAPAEGSVLIQPRFLSNALDGDTVSIALFARATEAPEGTKQPPLPEGEIVEIVERSNKPIVGTFEKSKHFFFVVPDNTRVGRDVFIAKGKTAGARPGQKVVVVIDDWASRQLNPEGHIIEVLGKAGEVRAEMASVARQFRLPTQFPKEVISQAATIEELIPDEEYSRRLDLRMLECFTIDPEDAKDFDDAVSFEVLPDKNFQLGVHIADVSHYVQEGTPLDKEAYTRGTSVYLADSVIPMLPEKLSNDICSLRPMRDRLTYSVLMTITPKGTIKQYHIAKTVIKSKRRFSYEEVQKIIEAGYGEFAETITGMHALSQTLLKKRMKEGSIDFESVETKFRFDEHGKPTEIVKKLRLDAHRLVEEFMLLANQVVAKEIGLSKKEEDIKPFIYRIHDLPDPDRIKDFASFVEHLGHRLDLSGGVRTEALQKLLNDVRGTDEENVINEVAIRSMAKAVYSETNIGHFGLGFKYYTHFTSPIRRYPDLIVHRLLFEYGRNMSHKRREEVRKRLPDLCQYASAMERTAMEAERKSVKVMQVEYMKRHVGEEFHAIISGVTNFGMFVEITDLLVEGLIRVRDMADDYYVYDEKHYALNGRRTKKRYRLGDKVVVQVVRVDPEDREIDFALVE